MEEILEQWSKTFNLKNLKLVGYHGGYPIIQFDKEDNMKLLAMSENERKRIIRNCETHGGIELGVGWNFVRTAVLRINDDSIVMAGHEDVLRRMHETFML